VKKRLTLSNQDIRFVFKLKLVCMKKHLFFIVGLLCATPSVSAQRTLFTGFQSPNIDNSVYTAMQNIWFANERISYVCPLPVIKPVTDPLSPLRQGEGEAGGHIGEGNIYMQIPIAMGRNHSNHTWATSRLTFDFGFNIRMVDDSSNPLIPNNNIAGLTYEKKIWNSYTKRNYLKSNKMYYAFDDWMNRNESLHDLSLSITAHHYSNGQQTGFYYYGADKQGMPVVRNDYKKGDFSTNYIRAGLTYSYLSRDRNLFSANLSYQLDGGIGGPLVYSTEQENSYGHHRLQSFLQYRWLLLYKRSKRQATIQCVCDDVTTRAQLKKYREVVIRWEPEMILDDVSQYRTSDGRKHRFNQHVYVQYTQPNWRAFGIVFHAYYGRDYSNIRYDLPIYAIMFGASVNFNKYYPALSTRQRYWGEPQCIATEQE
jgi:hypothetical protein